MPDIFDYYCHDINWLTFMLKDFQLTVEEVDATSSIFQMAVYSFSFVSGQPTACIEVIFINQVFLN